MITKDHNNHQINFSIDNLDQLLKAKTKARNVIESCRTDNQLDGAKRFVSYYLNASNDIVGASELELLVLEKRKKVSGKRFTKRSWDSLINKLKDGGELV